MDLTLLRVSGDALLASLARLNDAALTGPSRLPGWTRAHVVAHVAAAADSRVRLLAAAAEGRVESQYASVEARAEEIDRTAAYPPDRLRRRLADSVAALLAAAAGHPADRWDAPGDWLGVGLAPVVRAVPSMRREYEYHHVDLDAGYEPVDWPGNFVAVELPRVVELMSGRPTAPTVTVRTPDGTWATGEGGVTVSGTAPAALAWLTCRAVAGGDLEVDPPGPLPAMPPLA
jgi:maleylpyruvate isomerase